MSQVEVRDLTVGFGAEPRVDVLDHFDLTVAEGEVVALVGPSGCGKSTLLRVLAGLLVPEAGTATVAGRDVRGRPGGTALMTQRDNLLPWRRALANAALGREIAGSPQAEAVAAARQQFERFGLAGFEEAWPAELSGGMRQRVALLRTFLQPQPVLLLDEPFGALDAITRRDVQGWLQEVWSDDRRTVLLVTHDVEEALWLADRVVVLSGRPARVVADVRVDDPRPRRPDLVSEPGFVTRRAELLAALEGGRG